MGTQGHFFEVFVGVLMAAILLVADAHADHHDEADSNSPPALVIQLRVDGAIGPATADYVTQNIDYAAQRQAKLIVLNIDTPGGLDSAMRDIVQAILNSAVPVATFVSPQGARAASAGTYILFASHIAAMAPATNLGAATPIQIGFTPEPPKPQQDSEEPDNRTTPNMGAMEKKAVNDASAYIRSLAELRGRNVIWAAQAVSEAASLSANEAHAQNVIDLIAEDTNDLLSQAHGKSVDLDGKSLTLALQSTQIETIAPNWRHQFLSVVTDPNVAYVLMLIGVYGLFLEFYSPGGIIPGVAGAICLLAALYAFQVLPISYAGLSLIALGIVLMIMEAFVASTGILGIGGVIAFAFGSIILMDTESEVYQIALPLIAAVTTCCATILVFVIGMLAKARRSHPVGGNAELLEEQAEALADFEEQGLVRVHGEIWQAVTDTPIKKGQRLPIESIHDLTLHLSGKKPATGDSI